MAAMQRKRRLGALALVSLLALALLPRLLVVVAPRADLFGHASAPAVTSEPSVQIGEELARGSIAVELLRGPLLSPLDYQYARFFGGSLVVELLAVPLFAVFGPRLWALKAVPVLFHLVAVLLTVMLLDRFATRRAAWIGGLLMALTPPGYTIVSTIAWGSHFESNTLALLTAYLFLDLSSAESGRGVRRLLLGAVMGFSIWFGYQCLVFVLAILALDLLRDRRSFVRPEMLAQAAGLAIGLVPWLVYNLRYDFTGLSIYGSSILAHVRPAEGRAGPLSRLATLAFEGLPASFFFKGGLGLSGLAWGAVASILLAGGTLAAAWSLRAEIRSLVVGLGRPTDPPRTIHPGVLAIAVLVVYLAAVAFSDFRIPRADPDVRQIRYVVLMLPFLCVAAAIGADAVASRGPAFARTMYGLVGFLLAVSLLGVLPYCDASRFGVDRDVRAAPEDGIGRWLAWRFGDDPKRLERIVEQASRKRTAEEQEILYASMGRFLEFMTRPGRTRSAWDQAHVDGYVRGKELLRSQVPEAYRRHFE
jgi:hypothetical protein